MISLSSVLTACFAAILPSLQEEGSVPAAPPRVPPIAPVELVTAGQRIPAVPEAHRALLRSRLAAAAERLKPNVVHLTIERAVGDGLSISLDASGLILDGEGRVVTIGSTLEQARRICVRFGLSDQSPRRARLLGIDEATDVGLLDIGAIEVADLDLGAAELRGVAASDPLPGSGADFDARFVVTLSGAADEPDHRVALGYLNDSLPDQLFQRRRYDHLWTLTVSRASPWTSCAGGVIARPDGQLVGLMLPPPSALVSVDAGGAPQGLLALPIETLRRGVAHVLAQKADGPSAIEAPRSWLGLGAVELDEPEFLRQLGVPGAIVVREVFEASPALAAGLAPHDLLLEWDGQPLTTADALARRVNASKIGSVVTLRYVRGFERLETKLTVGAW